jgi:gamma-glutamyltranspeptidase / glutathione hydrolase
MKKIISIALPLVILLGACNSGKLPQLSSGKTVTTSNAMVVSAHPAASEAGAMILARGGNAVDAAVATQFALAVCYPVAGNIGGGGFMVLRFSDGTAESLDFREKAPARSTRDMYLDEKGEVIEGLSTSTHLASGVPGTVDGMVKAHARYGTLPWNEVIQPAIDLAEKGFIVASNQASSLNSFRPSFIDRNSSDVRFVKDSPWVAGDTLRQPELAAILTLIRDNGRDGFYAGTTADLIVAEMRRGNGIITHDDLSEYNSVWRTPLTATYRDDYKIISMAPPSSGGVALLQLLAKIEPYDLAGMGFQTAESIHLMAEAERRTYADRAEFLGDPDFYEVPVKALLNPQYVKDRMSGFNALLATPSAEVRHGNPALYESDETTHFSVVDKWGNAVAVTTTINGNFGNGIVVSGAGFLMNNEMDDLSVKAGVPNMFGLVGGVANEIAPGKRMLSSMTPTIVEKNGSLFLVVGSPGGSTIITTVFQIIVNVVDFEMSLEEAVAASRFHHQWLPDQISYEKGGLDSAVIEALRSKGHKLTLRESIGRVDAILLLPDGTMTGAADRRGDNYACGF